jgi:hypothetical protein
VYNYLLVDFTFNREFSYYLIQVYIPCVMLIIVAYLSFWIDIKETTIRILLCLMTTIRSHPEHFRTLKGLELSALGKKGEKGQNFDPFLSFSPFSESR